MNAGRVTRWAAPAAVLLALLGAWGAPRADEDAAGADWILAVAGETGGHLEPCHCVEGMLGGFPRRTSALARLEAEDAPLLALDTGDQSSPDQHHPGILRAKSRAAYELLAACGTRAVAVGEQDLRLGVEPLARLAAGARVTLLGANLRRGDEAPFAERVELPLGGERVAWVTGVLDPALGDPTGALEVGPPGPAIRAALADAPAGALRVVLFHGPREAALALPEDLPADVIVCGHDAARPGPLERRGVAWVVETIRDGQGLARLDLRRGAEPRLTRIPLGGRVPDADGARRRVDAYYDEVRGLPEEPRTPVKEGGTYMSSQACAGCHEEAWAAFERSGHREAQVRIAALDERATLPECARCHVTGWGYESGFEDLDATPYLGEVGCEVCHGVGEKHVMAPDDEKRGYGLRVGFPESWRALCEECHHPPHTPDFDLEAALERIRHW